MKAINERTAADEIYIGVDVGAGDSSAKTISFVSKRFGQINIEIAEEEFKMAKVILNILYKNICKEVRLAENKSDAKSRIINLIKEYTPCRQLQ